MQASIRLRPFAAEDAEQVVELLQDVSVYRPDSAKVFELGRIFAEQKDSYACVAAHDERLVGFGSLFVLNRIRGGRSAIIEDMVIAADMRGHGIGRLVLEDLIGQAQKMACFKVTLESSEMAREFYRAAGFEIGGHVMKCRL